MNGDSIACRPGGPGASPFSFFNFNVRTAAISMTAAAGTAVFPLALRVAQINFQGLSVGILGMSLSTSLLNVVPLDTVCVVAALDKGPQLSIDGSVGIFLTHLVRQNATAAARFANARCNAIAMGEKSAYRLDSGQGIALYASSAVNVLNEISATLSVYWTPIPPGL